MSKWESFESRSSRNASGSIKGNKKLYNLSLGKKMLYLDRHIKDKEGVNIYKCMSHDPSECTYTCGPWFKGVWQTVQV